MPPEPTIEPIGGRPPTIRLLHLSEEGQGWVAIPKTVSDHAATPCLPFKLPPIPRSQIDWLAVAARRVWNNHGGCLAALLLVHGADGRWTLRIPKQYCGPNAARWSTSAEEFPGLADHHLLGGTFQAICPCKGESLIDALPAADGIHFLLDVSKESPQIMTFIRAAGQASPVNCNKVFIDDWAEAIAAAAGRLMLV